MKDIGKLFLLAFCISLTFVQADEIPQNGACKTAEIKKTYNKGWQTYISMGNDDIRDKISDYFNWDNDKMNATIFETTGNQKKLVYKSPEIDVDEYDDHYYIVEPSQTTKHFLIEFTFMEGCLNMNYTIYYEDENNNICNAHSNYTAKKMDYKHHDAFHMYCLDEYQFLFYSPIDDYEVTWYKGCTEVREEEGGTNFENMVINGNVLEVDFKDHSLDGVYFCTLTRNNVSMVTRYMEVTYIPPKPKPTVFNPTSSCTSANQTIEAELSKPIAMQKRFNVSETMHVVSWYKMNGTESYLICAYFEGPKHTYNPYEDYFSCSVERVLHKETKRIELTATLQLNNVEEDDYADYKIRMALDHWTGKSIYCYVTLKPSKTGVGRQLELAGQI